MGPLVGFGLDLVEVLEVLRSASVGLPEFFNAVGIITVQESFFCTSDLLGKLKNLRATYLILAFYVVFTTN